MDNGTIMDHGLKCIGNCTLDWTDQSGTMWTVVDQRGLWIRQGTVVDYWKHTIHGPVYGPIHFRVTWLWNGLGHIDWTVDRCRPIPWAEVDRGLRCRRLDWSVDCTGSEWTIVSGLWSETCLSPPNIAVHRHRHWYYCPRGSEAVKNCLRGNLYV